MTDILDLLRNPLGRALILWVVIAGVLLWASFNHRNPPRYP